MGRGAGQPAPLFFTRGDKLRKKIDWDLIQILALTLTVPVMLIIGAAFPSFLAYYR